MGHRRGGLIGPRAHAHLRQRVQAKEEAAIKELRRQLDKNVRAKPLPDMKHAFKVDYNKVRPATKPQPFRLSARNPDHVAAKRVDVVEEGPVPSSVVRPDRLRDATSAGRWY